MSENTAARWAEPRLVVARETSMPAWSKDRSWRVIILVTLAAVVALLVATWLMVGSIP